MDPVLTFPCTERAVELGKSGDSGEERRGGNDAVQCYQMEIHGCHIVERCFRACLMDE